MALHRLARLGLFCVILTVAGVTYADQVTNIGSPQTLESLLTGSASIQAGDKTFTDFSYTPAGGAPSANAIDVQAVQVDGDYGLHFFTIGVAPWSASGDATSDGALDFKVAAGSGNMIDLAKLWMPGSSVTGTGVVSIVENVFNEVPGQTLGSMMVTNMQGYSSLLATATLNPAQSFLFSFKNVIVEGGGNGTASISDFYQIFHQTPEPASLSLLMFGGMALLRRRARR